MLKFKSVALFATLAFSPLALNAAPITLNEAFDYNAYILGDMTGRNSDVEGRLAVGGNLDLDNFAVGLKVEEGSTDSILDVRNDATLRNTRIYNGDAYVGGIVDIDNTVGLYNGEDTSNPNTLFNDTMLDFDSINDDLLLLSSDWGAIAATSTSIVNKNDQDEIWEIKFSATDDFNVFDIHASDLSALNKRITVDLPTNSLNIINVFGDSVNLTQTGFHVKALGGEKHPDNEAHGSDHTLDTRHDGRYTNNVLFNFVDATNLSLSGIGFKGSILAPLADVSFYDGHIDGNFIAKSLSSPINTFTGQINDYRFGDIDVPAPGSLVLLIIAGAIMLRRYNPLEGKPS